MTSPPGHHTGQSVPRLSSSLVWKLGSNSLLLFLGLAVSVVLNRTYGQGGYGQLVIVFTVVSIATGLAGLGSRQTLLRYVPIFRERLDGDAFRHMVVTAGLVQLGGIVLLAALLWGGSHWLAVRFFHRPEVVGLLKVGVLYFIGFNLVMFTFTLLQALEDWSADSCLSLLYPALYLGFVLAAIVGWRAGVVGVLYSNVAAALTTSTMGLWRAWNTIGGFGTGHALTLSGLAVQGRTVFSFGLPLALGDEAGAVIIGWSDKAILARYVSLEELALYHIATIFYNGLVHLFKTLYTVLMPRIARLTGRGEEAIGYAFRAINFWFLHIGIVLAAAAFFLIDPAILWLYGPQYEGAVRVFRLFLLLFLFRAAFMPSLMFIVNVFGKAKESFLATTIRAVLCVLLYLVLIPRFGYEGTIASRLVTLLFVMGLFIVSFKEIRAIFPGAMAAKSAGLVAAIAVLLLGFQRGLGITSSWGLFVAVAAVYVCGLVLLKLIGPQERQMVAEALQSLSPSAAARIKPVRSEAVSASEQVTL